MTLRHDIEREWALLGLGGLETRVGLVSGGDPQRDQQHHVTHVETGAAEVGGGERVPAQLNDPQ